MKTSEQLTDQDAASVDPAPAVVHVAATGTAPGSTSAATLPTGETVLAELQDLVMNLRWRNVYPQMQDFIRDCGLAPGRGWLGIMKAIQEVGAKPADWDGFSKKFASLLEDVFLIGHKRIYVLKNSSIKPELIAPQIPAGQRVDIFVGKAPLRSASKNIYYLGQETKRRATIHKFVTCRIITKTEEIEKNNLNESGQLLYETADLYAKHKIFCRCYDYIVILDGKAYLLIDAPPNVDSATIFDDERFYDVALKQQIGTPGERIYVDLFPAVQRIYEDQTEGKVYLLGFMSDDRAQIVGSYAATSDLDWRENKYHIGGSEKATVSPYKLGVKWPDRADKPLLLLPGQPVMLGSLPITTQGQPGTESFPLRYMVIPRYVGWDSFMFAIGRIHSQLSKISR